MTIARRLVILLVVPLLAFVALGIFNCINGSVPHNAIFVSDGNGPGLTCYALYPRILAQ